MRLSEILGLGWFPLLGEEGGWFGQRGGELPGMQIGPKGQQVPVRVPRLQPPPSGSEPQDGFSLSPRLPPLAEGVPFRKGEGAAIQGVMGFPISHEGLTHLYGSCLEGSQCFVTDLGQAADNQFQYRVSWRDLEGRELAHATTYVARHGDGSMELHRSNVFVVPECRGRALSIKVMAREIELLRKASTHPDSRITLEAGYSSVEGQPQRLGAYTWGHYGFDFADRYPQGKSRLTYYDSDCSMSQDHLKDGQLMRQQFQAWVKYRFRDASMASTLLKLGAEIQHPWELAELSIAGQTVPSVIGDQKVDLPIGKAFLVSEFCSNWSGVFRVNDPNFAGREVAERVFGPQLARAEATSREEHQRLLSQLDQEPELALKFLRVRGDASWIPRLEALSVRRPDLAGRVEEAVDRIRCVGFVKRLKRQLWSESTRSVVREQRARMDKGWPGYVCKLGEGVGDRTWTGRLKSWASRWFGDGD